MTTIYVCAYFICMHVCMYVHIYIYVYMYVQTHAPLRDLYKPVTRMYVLYVCLYASMYACTYLGTSVCLHAGTRYIYAFIFPSMCRGTIHRYTCITRLRVRATEPLKIICHQPVSVAHLGSSTAFRVSGLEAWCWTWGWSPVSFFLGFGGFGSSFQTP